MPKALKKPRLSTGPSESDQNMYTADIIIQQIELDAVSTSQTIPSSSSMHSRLSNEAKKEKDASLQAKRCDTDTDFDQQTDQGQPAQTFLDIPITPRASILSTEEALQEIETDQAGNPSDPPQHLKLLEACVGSFTMQNVRPYQEVCSFIIFTLFNIKFFFNI